MEDVQEIAEQQVENPVGPVTAQDGFYAPADISDSVQKREAVPPCALELFAGSCKLSKCLKSHGFAAYGIDHQKCKNRVGPCVVMDLTKKSSRKFLRQVISSGKVGAVPMAPPCGTSSRAREKPIPARLKRLGVPQPKPLRSSQYPLGFPWLRGTDLVRVRLANECYETVAEIFELCVLLGIPAFIENPATSRMWEVPCIRKLFKLKGVHFTKFHACMHGGDRDKLTALLHNCPPLCELALRCDGGHSHRPWSVSRSVQGGWKFDTASEAEYPLLLCQRMAKLFSEAALSAGWLVSPEPKAANCSKGVPTAWKIAAGRQPRGRRSHMLLPEDGQVVTLSVTNHRDVTLLSNWKGRIDREVTMNSRCFPKGTRLIHFQKSNNWGEHGDQESYVDLSEPPTKRVKVDAPGTAEVLAKASLGIPMTPLEAVRRSRQVVHPFDVATQVSRAVEECMEVVATRGFDFLHNQRTKTLRWVKERARRLDPEEHKLKKSMHPGIASILKDKKLLLFKELLDYIGHPDQKLVDDIIQGMRITGNADQTGVFPVDFRPAQLEEEDLWRVSKFSQKEVQEKIPRHMMPRVVRVGEDDVDVCRQVWSSTLSEVEKGWLKGPLSADQVSEEVGPLWTPSRRFGIVQGGKIRNIDDLSEFAVNQTYGTPEKLDLGGVDEVVALASAWTKKLGDRCPKLVGRCLDLKSAYKQLPLSRKDRPNAVLAVLEPETQQVMFFISGVLPFGATGAVMAFNRTARAIRDLMQSLFLLPVVNYFDDFPHVDVQEGATRSQAVMEEFLDVLGWSIARDQGKRLPAGPKFTVLGVVVDLSESEAGIIKVANKPERVKELREVLDEVQSGGSFPPSLAARIQGRMMFAEAQCCGRWLVPILEPIKARALMPSPVRRTDDNLINALKLCCRMLEEAPVRRISPLVKEPPCVVFTDGAYEAGVATCGVVVLTPRSPKVFVMSFTVPDDVLREWKKDGHEQVIAQAELLPVLLVKKQMRWALEGSRVLYFIDNEGVKEALITGVTKSTASKSMLIECMKEDSQNQSLPWYARIPSPSNISDGPSRLCTVELFENFDVEMVQPMMDYKEWGKIG